VYGVSPKDPALFTEDMEAVRLPRAGFAKDSVEVEAYVRGFARRRPDVDVTLLRFANIMGPGIDTPLTRYFSLPVVPTVLGFDARVQLTHEDDALAALERGTFADLPGTYNVAGDGVIMLSQAIARAGRVNLPLPQPFASVTRDMLRRFGYIDFTSEQIEFLKYGRVIDSSRASERLGFSPTYNTRQTFDAFLRAHPLGRVLPWDVGTEPDEATVTTIGEQAR
jgi:UDP-glucose 4-epimerase